MKQVVLKEAPRAGTLPGRLMNRRCKEMAVVEGAAVAGVGAYGPGLGGGCFCGIAIVVVIILLLIAMGIVF